MGLLDTLRASHPTPKLAIFNQHREEILLAVKSGYSLRKIFNALYQDTPPFSYPSFCRLVRSALASESQQTSPSPYDAVLAKINQNP